MNKFYSYALHRSFLMPQENTQGTQWLPAHLKAGIEYLSGIDMSDVEVHYNSEQPAQVNAYAFAQGNHIYLAPGQEQYLPHEAWHIVQQKQGRVKPTAHIEGHLLNDDTALEQEADLMGEQALQISLRIRLDEESNTPLQAAKEASVAGDNVIQRVIAYEKSIVTSKELRQEGFDWKSIFLKWLKTDEGNEFGTSEEHQVAFRKLVEENEVYVLGKEERDRLKIWTRLKVIILFNPEEMFRKWLLTEEGKSFGNTRAHKDSFMKILKPLGDKIYNTREKKIRREMHTQIKEIIPIAPKEKETRRISTLQWATSLFKELIRDNRYAKDAERLQEQLQEVCDRKDNYRDKDFLYEYHSYRAAQKMDYDSEISRFHRLFFRQAYDNGLNTELDDVQKVLGMVAAYLTSVRFAKDN